MNKWEKIACYLMVFMLIHMSSGASVISLSDVALVLLTLGTLVWSFKKGLMVDKGFLLFTFFFVSLAFFYLLQFGWVNFTATTRIFVKILYAYFTMKLVGWRFMHHVEDIIGKLALISIPLFAAQYIAPDLMMRVNGFLEVIIPQVSKGPGVDYSNSIIFTVNPWGLDRNSGFMWEPGAYAAMLSMGMFLNLIIYQFRFNWKLLGMAIAMITTESTTGYFLLAVIGFYWVVNQKLSVSLLTFPIVILGVMAVLSNPEIHKKIVDRYENRYKTIDNQENYVGKSDGISIGRFGSFILDWQDLQKYPIIGYGLQQAERTTGRYVNLVRANGLSDYMAKFGIVGMIFLFWGLTTTFTRFGRFHGARANFIGTILVCILAFSNPVLVKPFFISLMFYSIAFKFQQSKTNDPHRHRHTNIQSENAFA